MDHKIFPRVLVISHNAFSTTSNMGKTLASFFYGWGKNEIAQLYFHMEFPNSDICDNYFRITDFEMLKSILKFEMPGEILNKNDVKLDTASNNFDTGIKSDIYRIGKEKKSYMYFLRNLIWDSKKWKSNELSKWLEDFSPEVVFFAAGDYSFSMKIALNICNARKIPLVVFFGDDYYVNTIHKGRSLNFLNRRVFKSVFSNMFSYLSNYITASDKMLREYSEIFNKSGHAIMTSTEIVVGNDDLKSNKVLRISYIGNLGGGRWRSLVEIGLCLKSIGFLLDIYSAETRNDIIKDLNEMNGIVFHGAIPAYKVKEIIRSSTIIIHVESFESDDKERTQYSMSTKIAESLGSGVCLLAYGPKDVSSIEYLLENEAAYVVTEKLELKERLIEIIESEELRGNYINNAISLALQRHEVKENTKLFYEIMLEASFGGGS
ncbi:glycosyltransferase family protein [Paenibacillus sp. 22594]|uniref:glycosyltransferase family protein n=1 Tax=Paenibacillus sp. 22594 TaxID=3453947 RepID=UPI003F87478A